MRTCLSDRMADFIGTAFAVLLVTLGIAVLVSLPVLAYQAAKVKARLYTEQTGRPMTTWEAFVTSPRIVVSDNTIHHEEKDEK